MSIDVLRDDALTSRRHSIADVQRRHAKLQRDLRHITSALSSNARLDELSTVGNDEADLSTNSGATSSVKSGSLLKLFDPDSIPTPSIPQYDASIYASKPNRPPSQPTQSPRTLPDVNGNVSKAAVTDETVLPDPMAATVLPRPASTNPDATENAKGRRDEAMRPSDPDSTAVVPEKVVPPEPEEQTNRSPATRNSLDVKSPQKPAKTVHLPPEDVQEERKRERDEVMAEERGRPDLEKPSRPNHLHAQTELASSPSSTVGAYSTATPMPPQDSPNTSPESQHAEVLPPKELRSSEDEQQSQQEHDRLLAAQKDIAKRQAMGTEGTADDQLQWEAREAAARDSEEQAAKQEVGGPEADSKQPLERTCAEEVMQEAQPEAAAEQTAATIPADGEMPDATSTERRASQPEEDGDNITVVPRNRARDGDNVPSPQPESATSGRMTTRVSSGAMRQKSVSEITGESPAPPSNRRTPARPRQASSPRISPMTMRHPHDLGNGHHLDTFALPKSPRRPSQQTDRDGPSTLNDLTLLKGFAEDPERDYLEPLFRIQAHDSPQNKWTKPLGELVKMANKSMSTEDQFTTLHERMDYRILRRIYQLQNANKWSLRQMEKVKEPPLPITHWDHMMNEMKWMRKDFKAERNMKKRVCAYLASQCQEYVECSDDDAKLAMMTNAARRCKIAKQHESEEQPEDDQPPELDGSGESAPEDEMSPQTPRDEPALPTTLVVAPELTRLVCDLRKSNKLDKALESLPVVGFTDDTQKPDSQPLTTVSKFVEAKVMPVATKPIRKRSRYDYEDDADMLAESDSSKRLRTDRYLEPEDHEVALFHPDNKPIRDRLHANNAFRPPSENPMPSTAFYEFRNGSQWIWEDDQKLRNLAKEYSFNWQLIADEMTLQSRYKSSAERRTPWECFERWVELETLPAEMRKTLYFKTWFQRLEQSQQAAERRYQAQVAAIQQQAQANGQPANTPQRRRTVPTKVEKRKNVRYLWLVDAMRKLARKRENNSYKQAEAARAAAQRKTQNDNSNQPKGPMLTPQEFSKRRHERDLQIAEAQRQHRQKMIEAQQRQIAMARAAQQGAQGMHNGQQRPGAPNMAQQHPQMQVNNQQHANMNGQMPQHARPPLPMTTRNGHLAVPQVNAQGIPQAQMQPGRQMSQQDMQRLAQQNAQQRGGMQYPNQQQYQMPNGHVPSPGQGGMSTAQQLQSNQQLLAQMQQQQHHAPQQAANSGSHGQGTPHQQNAHPVAASPSMPPPPTPHAQNQQQPHPPSLSSGHVPAVVMIKNQLRQKHPNLSEDQLNQAATSALREQSQSQAQSTNQARQNAMNAAAGINQQGQHPHAPNMQSYSHNQSAYQNNQQMPNSGNGAYMNGDSNSNQSPNMQRPQAAPVHQSPQAMAAYANRMRQQQMGMMGMQQSPNGGHAQLNGGSPAMTQASPNMAPSSPSVNYSQMQNGQQMQSGQQMQNSQQVQNGQQMQNGQPMQNGQQMTQMNGQGRPPSRSQTPQMQRLGSSGSAPGVNNGMGNGMQSPGGGLTQGSPRNVQTSVAR